MKNNPILAISLGDPTGIAPEIIAKALASQVVEKPVCIFGHWPSLERAVDQYAPEIKIEIASDPGDALGHPIAVVDCGPVASPLDEPCHESAVAQLAGLERAVDAVLNGTCAALVTGPVSKHVIASLRPGFTGHTEYLAQRSAMKPDEVTMTFVSGTLAVGLVTTHESLKNVPSSITLPRLERTVNQLGSLLERLHPGKIPKIGLSALNPHAGENGVIGDEERNLLIPFRERMSRRSEFSLIGPIPAETLFRQANRGLFDGVVAMYHDQAMIPLKLSGVAQMVNITLGLPFVRTSPDHGTAYDIARTGTANPNGMKLALALAAKLTK